MPSGTIRTAIMILSAICAFGGAAQAQAGDPAGAKTLALTLAGTLGPIISGNDPAGLDGESATVTVTASESIKPYRHTANSASYYLPAGAVTVDVNGTDYTSTSRSKMMIKLSGKADLLTFESSVTIDGFKVSVTDTSALQTGSWTKSALRHPALFSPSPQNLTSPSSTFTYTVIGETTVLGVTGTASDSDGTLADKD